MNTRREDVFEEENKILEKIEDWLEETEEKNRRAKQQIEDWIGGLEEEKRRAKQRIMLEMDNLEARVINSIQKLDILELEEELEEERTRNKNPGKKEEGKKTPNRIGDEGESEVMKILKMAFPFPENKIQMISRKKNCGDISLEIKSSKIMIEVKNIEGRVVPKKDRNKFIKNLEMNSDYTRGLLVCLKSKVDSAVQPNEVQVHHGKNFVSWTNSVKNLNLTRPTS